MTFRTRRVSRRDAITTGGAALSIGALLAACGEGVGGSEDPGRVGQAPPVTDLPNYAVDDTVRLRTASSLEYTAVAVYETALAAGLLPAALTPTVDRLVANHQALGDRFGELTVAAGGEAWTCTNEWYMQRLVAPVLEAITVPREFLVVDTETGDETVETTELTAEEMVQDTVTFATALEELAVASHQEFSVAVSGATNRVAHGDAASLEARQAAVLAIAAAGEDKNYISPALIGEDVTPDARGGFRHFAIPSTFGQTAQIEIKAGPPDLNGVRQSFILQTPAENSFVYNELTCTA